MQLVQRGVYPQARYDEAKAGLDRSDAMVAGAEAELERARRELGPVGDSNPQIREALAALERARLDLARATVVAPADGVVTNLQLAPGQYVGAGQAALTFVDAGTIWITAAFKENSLEHVRAGNAAEVVFDTFPGRVFTARVESVGWGVSSGEPTQAGLPTVRNDSGWIREPQRFPVRLVFDGRPPIGVRYGSQANIVIYTGDNPATNVLGAFFIRLVALLTYVS
jgi:multidrug resistance efflux pump